MVWSRWVVCAAAALGLAAGTCAQREKRQTLTEAQVEKVREAGIDPTGRVKLYVQFLNERAETLKALTSRGKSGARSKRVDDELLDFAALMDELGSNLDQYGERKADMRPALKKLNEDCAKWIEVLEALPPEPAFELARKEAIQSGQDLAGQAKDMLAEQTKYFETNKKAKGQEREEPQ